MTPQELKNSILQLAIEGKLVPQCPEEGTAEELYRQIQTEKQALIKAGKIKKERPLPEITEDEKPFDIPESWKWVRWGELSESIQYGYNAPAKEKGRIRMVRISDIQEGNVCWNTVPFCDIDEKDIETYLLGKNDILFARTGGTVGKSFLVKEVPYDAVYAGYLIRTRYSALLCPEYLKCFMESQLYWDQLHNGTIATAQPNCNGQTLSKMLVPLPPLAEQKRIVAKIEELLPLIDRYEEAWTKLEAFNKRFPGDLQKSLLQMAIQGKLVPQLPEEGTGEELYAQIQNEKQSLIKSGKLKKEKPLPEITDDEKPFDIPESWKWVRLLTVVDIATNLVQPSEYQNYMHIAPDNIEKSTGHLLECHTVREDKVASANHLFCKGQIIYSKIRPLLRKAVIAPFDGLCSADMYPLNTELNAKYVLYYLLSDGFNTQIAEAMSSRVKMPKINQDELSKVLFPLPPLAEQKRIVAKLEELLPLCTRLLEMKE